MTMEYRRCGRSGLDLPVISFGLWHHFGDGGDAAARAMIRRAFDAGVTHFDLANNYGPPPGAAEERFGRVLREDLRGHRDELVVSTKAGWDMWPGPYGDFGSRKHLLASLDQSLARLGVDYVDVFYHHRPDPRTPLEETLTALADAVRSGKALYAGVSSYDGPSTAEAAKILADLKAPLLVHQAHYSMLSRTIEHGLLDTLAEAGVGCVAFAPLSMGLLTDRYLDGTIPADSRAAKGEVLSAADLTDGLLTKLRALSAIADRRGQRLSQLALAWALRDERVTSVLTGAGSVEQLDTTLGALDGLHLAEEELREIDEVLEGGDPFVNRQN
ncbi:aldo/keto reductase [Glycomyces artemisiae]|uniref:L-glyceraldehyde 3-phosphate reductase n=1 Tax=Glycomyces artemisiae TaxID=1076443 RepID=A0A2T0UL88_9ACTN|nr:aldo/keto reductase [Glycomyces artemisiae]PRY58703.1 L-glyceraldehyde 3-phosphate reductase [Glycomyces artemisiae]